MTLASTAIRKKDEKKKKSNTQLVAVRVMSNKLRNYSTHQSVKEFQRKERKLTSIY